MRMYVQSLILQAVAYRLQLHVHSTCTAHTAATDVVIRLSQRISAGDVPRGARAARRHRAGPRDPACTPKSPGDIYYIRVTARHLAVSPLHVRRPAFCAFAQVEGPPRAPPSPWFPQPPSPCPALSPCPITITLQYTHRGDSRSPISPPRSVSGTEGPR